MLSNDSFKFREGEGAGKAARSDNNLILKLGEKDSTIQDRNQQRSQNLIKRGIGLRRVTGTADLNIDDFVEVYRTAFSGKPYYETFSQEHVINHVLMPHVKHCLIVAEEGNRVVGLACGHPVSASGISPSACRFLEPYVQIFRDPGDTLYISELAVAESHRGLGIGFALLAGTFTWAANNRFPVYVSRTAATDSNSLHLFERLGAKRFPELQDVTHTEFGASETSSRTRVYVGGNAATFAPELYWLEPLLAHNIFPPFSDCSG